MKKNTWMKILGVIGAAAAAASVALQTGDVKAAVYAAISAAFTGVVGLLHTAPGAP